MSSLSLDMPVDFVIDLRDSATAAPAATSTAISKAAPAQIEAGPLASATIGELVQTEEDLSFQAHLGDLHPAHAMRLAAVTAELDRRWSTFG